MDNELSSKELAELMLKQDYFSTWLGIEILEVDEKYCKIKMEVREDMINGLRTLHGGVSFSLADSALAFSSNNTNDASVALQCSINFTQAARAGDVLYAESKLISETRKTGIYNIELKNQLDQLVAVFRGTVYKIGKKVTEL